MLTLSLIVLIIGIVMAARQSNSLMTRLVGVAVILIGLSNACTAVKRKLFYHSYYRRSPVIIMR